LHVEIAELSHDDPVAPAVLRLIQGGIGALQKAVDGLAGLPFGNAEAASHGHLAVCNLERERSELFTQAFGMCHAGFEVRRFEQNRELFTAETANCGAFADGFTADGAKDLVSDVMPIQVIDALEMVDIEHDRGRAFRTGGSQT
jgi:hypothetical protein